MDLVEINTMKIWLTSTDLEILMRSLHNTLSWSLSHTLLLTNIFRIIQRHKPGKRKPILSTDGKKSTQKSWNCRHSCRKQNFFIDISTYRDSRLQIHLHTIQMRCHPRRSSRCWSSTSRSFPPLMCTRRSWTRQSWTGSRLRINNNLGWR